jgi:sulfatase maturation enzyme AslB (radical SAM superfamily)
MQQLIAQWELEKKSLEQGKEISGCAVCWRLESQGKQSYRQQNGLDNYPNSIEIHFSNACNHMCSYCSPKYSTTWQDSIRTHGLFSKVSRSTNLNLGIYSENKLDQEKWLDEIQRYISQCEDHSILLTLLGGEPLMQKANLEKFLNLQNSKIKTLRIVTNLNPPDNKFLIWLLTQYSNKQLMVDISIDSTPDFNHVPRAGFDTGRFLKNLDLLKEYGIDFKFMPVVSALSIFDLPNFLPWVQKNNFLIQKFSRIHNPLMLDPTVVPQEFRNRILDIVDLTLLPENVQKMLTDPTPLVDLKLFEQYNYLEQYFQRTGLDPTQVNNDLFVEYWNWLTKRFT